MPTGLTRLLAATTAVLALAAGTVTWAAPASAQPVSGTGASRDQVIADYRAYVALEDVPNAWTGAVSGCDAGSNSPAYQQATLDAINYFRRIAGLAPVGADPAMTELAQQAALISTAAGALSHAPDPSQPCWTQAGYDGASHSNLHQVAGPAAIRGYLADPGETNAAAGHRRWVLYPQLTRVGIGNTGTDNALYVIDGAYREPSGPVVTWPTAGYFPSQLEPSGRWSISVPGASFSAATASATVNGAPLSVTTSPVVDGYGDNTLSFQVAVPEHGTADLTVNVAVSGVRLSDGSTQTLDYAVTLVDASPPAPPAAPEVSATAARRAITVTWTAPDDASAAYTVRAVPQVRAGQRPRTLTCATTDRTCRLARAVPGVTYLIEVTAANDAGEGTPGTVLVRVPRR